MCSQDMKEAYRISSRAVREKMRKDKPLDEEYLNKVNRSDVVVVSGQYDRVQDVLNAMEIPHMTVNPLDVGQIKLNSSQIIFISKSPKLVPSPNNPNSSRTFANTVSFNCAMVIRDGIA